MISGSTILSFAIYLAAMLAIGIYFYFKTKNATDYVLGGRRLGPIPSAISSTASDMSGWLLLGMPGFVMSDGMQAGWMALGLIIGFFCAWTFMARRLRIYSERLETITVPGFIEKRVGDKSGLLRLVLAIFILFFFMFYTASGLVAGAKLFNSAFNVPYHTALMIGAGIIVAYTLVGGYLAVSWTDVIQGILMIGALVFVPICAYNMMDANLVSSINQINPEYLSWSKDLKGNTLSAISILSLLAWGLGYFGQPHIVTRFMGINNPNKVGLARNVAVSWSAIMMIAAIFVGLLGVISFNGANSLGDSEKVFLAFIKTLFHPFVAGILLAAVMAAIMSTADSQLLVASSAFTSDIFQRWVKPNMTEKEELNYGRISLFVIAVIAVCVSWNEDSTVLGIVSYAWAGLGATAGPIVLISLYWKGVNSIGAIAATIVGGVTVIIWNKTSGGIFDMYELLPAFLLSSITLIIISKITHTDKEVVKSFEEFEKSL